LLSDLSGRKGAHLTMGGGRRQARFASVGILKVPSGLPGLKNPKPVGGFIQIGK